MKRKGYSNKWACCGKARSAAFCDQCGKARPQTTPREEALALAADFDAYARGKMAAADTMDAAIAAEQKEHDARNAYDRYTTYGERWEMRRRNAEGNRECARKFETWAKIIRDAVT